MKMLFSIQKSLIAAAIMLVAVVYSTQTCLYCRRMDVNAGFLVSYSYCNATDECVQDQWNYINRPCNDDWQLGKNLDLAKCNALPVACIDFESTPEKATQYFNRTWTLPVQSYCTIKVDANQEVARVVFDSTSFLGVELDDYQIGDVITVDSGVQEVTIYNAAQSGSLTFLISFSGAYDALSKFAALIAAATLTNLV